MSRVRGCTRGQLEMKRTIYVAAILAVLIIATSPAIMNVMAKKKHLTAEELGRQDGADSCQHEDGCHWYILGKDKGFAHHTEEYNNNNVNGFCETGHGSSDADEATFDCPN